MALDGIVVASLAKELQENFTNARLSKIAQPEKDELLLTMKGSNGQKRLLLSASASLPLVYISDKNKPSPMTAPNFCMLLRKHVANGRITAITQPGMERIIVFEIEHLDDLGDLRHKKLIIELMGKHSNIIFCDENDMILDSIKHISAQVSSVREVLPGRTYFIPAQQDKMNPLEETAEHFTEHALSKPCGVAKAIYTSYTGISPLAANEFCYRADVDGDAPCASLNEAQKEKLAEVFLAAMIDIREGRFYPNIIMHQDEPVEYAAIPLTSYASDTVVSYDSISEVLENYYAQRSLYTRMRQKSADLRHVITTLLERNRKKYDLQKKQLKDTEKREKYKVYGELIHTYGYNLEPGAKVLEALNYYNNEIVKIPLDTTKTPLENAQRYFEKYNKQKRTFEALSALTEETKEDITYLESVSTALDIALSEEDLAEIKEELIHSGYMRRKFTKKKVKIKNKPLHYLSSDGYHIYVGKNNLQNDWLTFEFAVGNDWWFHAKNTPGSHVVVRTNGDELPDRTFEEAGRLAAYYSKARGGEKVEIDYIEKKHVKKPKGAKPGFVVYYTNYSLIIDSDIGDLKEISD